jgi:regulator of RNase E activity RraA
MGPQVQTLRDRVADLAAPAILDAVMRRHEHTSHLDGLVTPTPGRVLFGPAVTIQYVATRLDIKDAAKHNFATKFYEALGDKPDGKVLVLSSGGYTETSLGGGTKLSRLHNHGLAGVVADGRLRDFHELGGYDFATYCRGETSLAGDGSVMPFVANVPVSIGPATVVPGDYVYADEHGGVVIPGPDLEWVLKEARRLEDEDQAWIRRIRDEDAKVVLRDGSGEK